ncbi:glycosylase [Mucilaginibacter lacusdianchii]|uniref:glycosylase n=1 Tax=Mucilaginibacter lacusdianchii TaxID=2684211 RepID=UPI00131DD53C|nr:glycosylase [Mucilaginibacter sp. JXJ CY 39]
MKKTKILSLLLLMNVLIVAAAQAQTNRTQVPDKVMQEVYEKVKTPHKYGLVIAPTDNSQKADCPSVFRKGNQWCMTYIIFNGRGYETWLANSKDLLHWTTKGRILSFSDTTDWDSDQKAGYIALQDTKWGGSYQLNQFQNKYWMSYFGGHDKGYEKGLLSISMAYTDKDPSTVHEWQRLGHPVLMATDNNVSWWDNHTLYKETVIKDNARLTGYPFVMYYNANGDSLNKKRGAERIGMAVSNDMVNWKRFQKDPVLNHNVGITGDPYLQKMGDLWVMFYFGAFWKEKGGAFNRFACSYDLVNWTEWKGDDLIQSSEPYDNMFAHKSFVVKHKGVVYHFYCAVNKADQRGIAVATSKDMGKSQLNFVEPPPSKKKK